jgi:ATP synthase protein I
MDKNSAENTPKWSEDSDDTFKTLSKAEMEALRLTKPQNFATVNAWFIVGMQILTTLVIASLCYFFADSNERAMYTYSAFVGGLIGFLPSALFLARLEAAKKNIKSSPGGYLSAVVSGEFIKILATILLFIYFALNQPDLKWMPLLVTYLITLKCYFAVWFWK